MQDLAGKRKSHPNAMATAVPMQEAEEGEACAKQDYFTVLLSLKLQDEDMAMQ